MTETAASDLELVDSAEIAVMLAVQRGTVKQWRRRGLLPEPAVTVGGRPAWRRDDILAWAVDTGRLPD